MEVRVARGSGFVSLTGDTALGAMILIRRGGPRMSIVSEGVKVQEKKQKRKGEKSIEKK